MTDIFWTAIDKPTPSGRNARSHSRKPPTRARVSRHSARLLGKTVSGTDFGDRMGRGTVIVCNGLCSAAALSVRIAGAVSRSAARGKHCFGAPAEVSRPPWLGVAGTFPRGPADLMRFAGPFRQDCSDAALVISARASDGSSFEKNTERKQP